MYVKKKTLRFNSILLSETMKTTVSILILGICCLVLFHTEVCAAKNVSQYVREGGSLLFEQPDSALYRFMLAYRAGMSKDSLKYYWAETYRVKGVYDSALILNHAITWAGDKREVVFNQRIKIYEALGWENKVHALRDSVGERGFSIREFPRISAGFNGVYSRKKEKDSYDVPFIPYLPLSLRDTLIQGSGYGGYLDFSWEAHGNFVFLGSASMSKPYYNRSVVSMDSSDIGFTAGVKTQNLVPGGSVGYLFGREWYTGGGVSSTHTLSVDYLISRSNYLIYMNMSYYLGLLNDLKTDRQYVSFISYMKNRIDKENSFFLAASALLYLDEPSVQPSWLDVNGSFYPADVYQANLTPFMGDSIFAGYTKKFDTKTLIPQGLMNISLTAGNEIGLPFGVGMRVQAQFSLQAYADAYKWSEMRICADSIEGYKEELFSVSGWFVTRNGDEYAFVKRVDENSSLYHVASDASYIRRSEKRTDNILTIGAALDRKLGSIGAIKFDGKLSKTWSTLKEAPVRIPNWEWTLGLSWKKTFDLNSIGRKKHAIE